MSNRPLRQFLVVAFGLSVSGLAFARTPPVLVKAQQAASQSSAAAAKGSGGYRDLNTRFGVIPARSPQSMTASGGYRDIHVRLPAALRPRA